MPYVGVYSISVAPTNTARIYSATISTPAEPRNPGGVYRSDDTGVTWQNVSGNFFADIQVHPITPTIVYALPVWGYGDGIHRSDDSGETWNKLSDIYLDLPKEISLLIDKNDPNRMYAYGAAHKGVYKSEDGGRTWTNTTLSLPPSPVEGGDSHTILSAALDPLAPSTIWISVKYNGMYVSYDIGQTWQPSNLGIWDQGSIAGPQCNTIALVKDGRHTIACSGLLYVRDPDFSISYLPYVTR